MKLTVAIIKYRATMGPTKRSDSTKGKVAGSDRWTIIVTVVPKPKDIVVHFGHFDEAAPAANTSEKECQKFRLSVSFLWDTYSLLL